VVFAVGQVDGWIAASAIAVGEASLHAAFFFGGLPLDALGS
jgi:hypothetical protein